MVRAVIHSCIHKAVMCVAHSTYIHAAELPAVLAQASQVEVLLTAYAAICM